MKPLISYKDHCKLKIISGDSSRYKHKCCKLLLVMILKNKYPHAGIYSEYELEDKHIVDVVIDLGDAKIYYEVQKVITPEWLDMIKSRDLNLNSDTIIIPLKELSNDITILAKELEEYIA